MEDYRFTGQDDTTKQIPQGWVIEILIGSVRRMIPRIFDAKLFLSIEIKAVILQEALGIRFQNSFIRTS
jgi:hypothetical protein